ncbi:Uncharacterised protein [Raoultella terrigena]|uniref:Uncharacterized protein n=1 Tax=Raoultella terrigena TaxID=577 RepID=A0A3P8LZX5_RAOTE|nr:Uncharacterised protein [Raoultella terrigena]
MLGKISILYCSCWLRITLNDCFQQNNNQNIIMVEISKFALCGLETSRVK